VVWVGVGVGVRVKVRVRVRVFLLRSLSPLSPIHTLKRLVESNSRAAVNGLKILDVILAVNNQDVPDVTYEQFRNIFGAVRDSNRPIELLVCEVRLYQGLNSLQI
jgi:hypothetical protein